MASEKFPVVVLVSIASAAAVTVTKFTAAIMTGSSAMISEGLKSFASTIRGVLLLIGVRLSQREPGKLHPFGWGKELFFWTLLSALLILNVGGGGSLYTGITKVIERETLSEPELNYIVIGLSAAFAVGGWIPAFRQLWLQPGGASLWSTLWSTRDTATLAVFLDGFASLLGLFVAFLGIYLTDRTSEPIYDGVAAIVIGLIWFTVLIPLIQRCRKLLVGEGADEATLACIRECVAADPDVAKVLRSRAMSCGAEALLLNVGLRFRDGLSTGGLSAAVKRVETALRERFDMLEHISIEAHP